MRYIIGAIVTVLLFATAAFAQTATVTRNAPIYDRPDPPTTLRPLRMAAVGSVLKVVSEEGDWVQVQFQDPESGLRIGWVRLELVTIQRPGLQPMGPSGKPQQPPPSEIPRPPEARQRPATTDNRRSIGVRGVVTYGTTTLSATRTFKAVTGRTSRAGPGGGAEIVNLWRGLFAGAAVSQMGLEGQRVYVINGTVYQLSIPVEITIRPIDVLAGWRLRVGRLEPFFGGGAAFVSYKETSSFAEPGEDVSKQKTGFVVIGGADVSVLRWLRVGGEVRYRAVSGILGAAGVSQVYGEKSLGGVSAAARITVGR